VSQCTKSIEFGNLLTVYCQGEEGHDGKCTPPPLSWGSLIRMGGVEGTDGERYLPPRKPAPRRRGARRKAS
jgi:hypothetical protein